MKFRTLYKRVYIFSILLLGVLVCQNAIAQKTYHIKGKIEGVKNEEILLFHWKDGAHVNMPLNGQTDRFFSKDGTFEFKGTITEPQMYQLYLQDKRFEKKIMVDIGVIEINADVAKPSATTIKGSKEQPLLEKFEAIFSFVKPLGYLLSLESREKEARLIKDTAEVRKVLAEKSAYEERDDLSRIEFSRLLKKNKDKRTSAYFLYEQSTMLSVEEMVRNYNYLSAFVKQSLYGKLLGKVVARKAPFLNGNKIPDIIMMDANDKKVDLKKYEGKRLLLIGWDGRSFYPHHFELKEYVNTNKQNNIEVIWVGQTDVRASSTVRQAWYDAILNHQIGNLDNHFYLDQNYSSVYEMYRYSNILVGADGRIIKKNLSPKEITQLL